MSLASLDLMDELANGAVDRMASVQLEWNGFDPVLRKAMHNIAARSHAEPQARPPALTRTDWRVYDDYIAVLYANSIEGRTMYYLAATALPDSLQYFWGAGGWPPENTWSQLSQVEKAWTQAAMSAANFRMQAMHPAMGNLGMSVDREKPQIYARADSVEWQHVADKQAAFDDLRAIARDFFRMTPYSIIGGKQIPISLSSGERQKSTGPVVAILGPGTSNEILMAGTISP